MSRRGAYSRVHVVVGVGLGIAMGVLAGFGASVVVRSDSKSGTTPRRTQASNAPTSTPMASPVPTDEMVRAIRCSGADILDEELQAARTQRNYAVFGDQSNVAPTPGWARLTSVTLIDDSETLTLKASFAADPSGGFRYGEDLVHAGPQNAWVSLKFFDPLANTQAGVDHFDDLAIEFGSPDVIGRVYTSSGGADYEAGTALWSGNTLTANIPTSELPRSQRGQLLSEGFSVLVSTSVTLRDSSGIPKSSAGTWCFQSDFSYVRRTDSARNDWKGPYGDVPTTSFCTLGAVRLNHYGEGDELDGEEDGMFLPPVCKDGLAVSLTAVLGEPGPWTILKLADTQWTEVASGNGESIFVRGSSSAMPPTVPRWATELVYAGPL